jgi:hypothetical protein
MQLRSSSSSFIEVTDVRSNCVEVLKVTRRMRSMLRYTFVIFRGISSVVL